MGKETYIFLFFGALKRFVNEEFSPEILGSEFGEEGEGLRKRMVDMNPAPLKELLEEVRSLGNLKLYACSGAVKLMDLEEVKVKSKVDDILGLTTIIEIADGAETQLFI